MDDRHSELVYLSLGSNLGDRQANLQAAADQLPPRVEVLARSSLYETKPWGYPDQPDFLNQVLKAETCLSPFDLLAYLKELEHRIGRRPTFRFGPREVDIDILLYGGHQIKEDRLVIPHQRLRERAFVLVPLAELSPDLVVPGSDLTVTDLLKGVDQSDVVLFRD